MGIEELRVSAEEARRMVEQEGWTLVDVRSVPEYEAGHPPGAYNVPWRHATPMGMEPNEEFVQVMEGAFGKEAKLILACRSGGRSLSAAEALRAAGFQHVLDQRGGFEGKKGLFGASQCAGWVELGFPVETGNPRGRSYEDVRARALEGAAASSVPEPSGSVQRSL